MVLFDIRLSAGRDVHLLPLNNKKATATTPTMTKIQIMFLSPPTVKSPDIKDDDMSPEREFADEFADELAL